MIKFFYIYIDFLKIHWHSRAAVVYWFCEKCLLIGANMKKPENQNAIPVYSLQKLNDFGDYSLLIDNDYRFVFLKGNLTNIVWHVTQEFHSHDFWEICLVIKGNSLQRFPDRSAKQMRPGSVCLLRPHDVHCVSPDYAKEPPSLEASTYIHRDRFWKWGSPSWTAKRWSSYTCGNEYNR